MIDAFEWKECDFREGIIADGLGGRKKLACLKDGTDRSFVVKYEEYWQSLNELIAQGLLKETGLNSMPTAWISPFNNNCKNRKGKWYGAVEYVSRLERLSLEKLKQENSHAVGEYIKHYLMGECIFNNSTETEIYKDSNNTVYSLDYGGIDVSELLLEAMLEYRQLSVLQRAAIDNAVLISFGAISADSMFRTYLLTTANITETLELTDFDCVKNAAKTVFGAFAGIAGDKVNDLMDSVEQHTNIDIAAYYAGWIERRQSACENMLRLLE